MLRSAISISSERTIAQPKDRYREALYYKDNDAIATFRLAVCLEKMDRPDEARTQYESYLKILPHGPQADEAQKAIEHMKVADSRANVGEVDSVQCSPACLDLLLFRAGFAISDTALFAFSQNQIRRPFGSRLQQFFSLCRQRTRFSTVSMQAWMACVRNAPSNSPRMISIAVPCISDQIASMRRLCWRGRPSSRSAGAAHEVERRPRLVQRGRPPTPSNRTS